MLGINEAANTIGLQTTCARTTIGILCEAPLPCIIHWNQNHFVVLYKVKKGVKFYVADPGKGLVTYSLDEFREYWISTRSNGEDKGIAMFLETTPAFFTYKIQGEENIKEKRSFRFLFGYVKKYRKYFVQIILGLDSRKPPAACSAISYPIYCRCRYQESRHRIRLAYTIGTVDAYYQSHCYRLYPQMAIAAYIPTYQHLFGKRFLHQTFEFADVFL